MATSAELIRACREGAPGAFGQVIEAHKDEVYTLCLRAIGDALVAENVAERVFLTAHQDIVKIDANTNLGQWLLQLTLHHVTDPVEVGEVDSESAAVNAVLGELEPPFRMAVILRDVLLLGERDVADILQISLGTARSRIHRGRLTMARNLVAKVGE